MPRSSPTQMTEPTDGYVWVQTSVPVMISGDLYRDHIDINGIIARQVSELLTYGQPRTHRGFMPEIVLFPTLAKLTVWWARTHQRLSDVRYAWKHGLIEDDDY